eukprot:363828-Chlamydomonas_euryale.AAC.4
MYHWFSRGECSSAGTDLPSEASHRAPPPSARPPLSACCFCHNVVWHRWWCGTAGCGEIILPVTSRGLGSDGCTVRRESWEGKRSGHTWPGLHVESVFPPHAPPLLVSTRGVAPAPDRVCM